MNLSDRRSFVYGLLVAAKLAADPELVLAKGRSNLRHLRKVRSDGSANSLLDRWEELLHSGCEELIAVLTSPASEAVELRHPSPFAGVLSEAERIWVIRTTRAAV